MVEIIISLEADDHAWLKRFAKDRRMTMTETVRLAVERFREEQERDQRSLDALLEQTKGIWPYRDGLGHQKNLRAEWP